MKYDILQRVKDHLRSDMVSSTCPSCETSAYEKILKFIANIEHHQSLIDKMPLEQKLKAIEIWQNCDVVHEMTCGNDSGHAPLVALVGKGDELEGLKCLDCNYRQYHIPITVFERYLIGE